MLLKVCAAAPTAADAAAPAALLSSSESISSEDCRRWDAESWPPALLDMPSVVNAVWWAARPELTRFPFPSELTCLLAMGLRGRRLDDGLASRSFIAALSRPGHVTVDRWIAWIVGETIMVDLMLMLRLLLLLRGASLVS